MFMLMLMLMSKCEPALRDTLKHKQDLKWGHTCKDRSEKVGHVWYQSEALTQASEELFRNKCVGKFDLKMK